MKKATALFCFITSTLLSFAQADSTSNWKKGGAINFTFSQVSLTNWAAGGLNTVSLNSFVNLYANYKKDKISWENSLDIGYGVINQDEQDWQKSDDRIELNSKFGKLINDKWSYSALGNFRTQFAPGFNLPNDSVAISDFMAPGYVLASIGIDYKPLENFSVFISPVTGKFTFVRNQRLANEGAFGVEAAETNDLGQIVTLGKQFRAELGGLVKFQYRKDVFENVTAQLKGDFFSNYLDNPEAIDVNMELAVDMKINKFLSANLNMIMIYDEDIDIEVNENQSGPRVQLKQVFGVGLGYKF